MFASLSPRHAVFHGERALLRAHRANRAAQEFASNHLYAHTGGCTLNGGLSPRLYCFSVQKSRAMTRYNAVV
jgi:hypothetical protein